MLYTYIIVCARMCVCVCEVEIFSIILVQYVSSIDFNGWFTCDVILLHECSVKRYYTFFFLMHRLNIREDALLSLIQVKYNMKQTKLNLKNRRNIWSIYLNWK